MKVRCLLVTVAIFIAPLAFAATRNGFALDVEVGGAARHEYHANGTAYIEAVRGQAYALRITNPMPYRVAVALAVDGLNTIDAKHSDAWSAAKWVLEPYESTTIRGWQVSQGSARKFFFTGEKNSYGAALGKTQNLGVIQAVFFREKPAIAWHEREERPRLHAPRPEASVRGQEAAAAAPPSAQSSKDAATSEDYAATGMGRRTRHEVTSVAIDLERTPVASISLRYEFRPQLVKLGVIPDRQPLDRRERARGFASYCPEPD